MAALDGEECNFKVNAEGGENRMSLEPMEHIQR